MATIKDRKAQLVKDYEAKISEVNKLCGKATNTEVEGKLNELKNIENEYTKLLEKEVFDACADVHEALVKHHFTTIHHKQVREEGVLTGVEKSDKEITIDLKRFCEAKNIDMAWFYELQSLNKRLTLKAATELGVSAKELKDIDNSYNMDKLAAEIELGKTPTSDTQIVKHMQKVLDTLSEGEGRVNGHDLTYLWMCYGKRNNKAALRVMCSKHNQLMTLLTDVFHRVVTDGVYGVDYKRKNSAAEVAEVAEVKADKPESKSEKKSKAKKPAEVSKDETVVVKKEQPAA